MLYSPSTGGNETAIDVKVVGIPLAFNNFTLKFN
jgi:hypothetical protein